MNLHNIPKYEFVGIEVEILDSKNKTLCGVKGKIVDETKNLFILENGKKILKSHSRFKMKIGKKIFEIEGSLLVGRPEDRIKKQIK